MMNKLPGKRKRKNNSGSIGSKYFNIKEKVNAHFVKMDFMEKVRNDYDFQIGAEPSHQLKTLNFRKRIRKLMQAVYIHITNSLLVNRLRNRLQKIKLLQTLQALITYYKSRSRSQFVTLKLIAAENIQTMAFKV